MSDHNVKATIDYTEAVKKVSSKKKYREAMIRNGWFMPALKSGLCTVQYMEAVRIKEIWCLKYENARMAPCPERPKKMYLVSAFDSLTAIPI